MLADDGSVVAIDSMVSGFDLSNSSAKAQFDGFLTRVGALVAALVAAPTTPHAAFGAVRALLLKGRGDESSEAYCPPLNYDIGEAGVLEIQAGFLSSLKDFDRLPKVALERLPRLVQDFLGEEGYGASRCDPAFLSAICQVFRRRGADSDAAADLQPTTLIRYGDHQMAVHEGGAKLQRLRTKKDKLRGRSLSSPGKGRHATAPPGGWTSASLALSA